ncbi:protein GbcA [Pseudomonas sp. SDI]|nr:protein GbcA [Pseudomonas sp. SDI]
MRKRRASYMPTRDIGVLIATSHWLQGLARRERIRSCRPWTWIPAPANAHSTANELIVYPPCDAIRTISHFRRP